MKLLSFIKVVLTFILFSAMAGAYAEVSEEQLLGLQTRWAEVNYTLAGDEQLKAFEVLIAQAEAITELQPDSAAAWAWSGIIKSTYAGAKGGLGALTYAKASKRELEQSLVINELALNGSAYTSLAALYCNVPGWPIAFGNDEKAEQLFKKALAINPQGMDSNYFYANFLLNEKRYQEAQRYMLIAKQAPKRANRPVADAGRMEEINLALASIDKKMKK